MKYGLVITLILALVLFWLLTLDNTETEVHNKIHEATNVRPDTVDEISVETVKSSEPGKDKTSVKQSEEPLPEGQLFHHDPIIDTIIGMTQYSVCKTYLSKNEQEQEKLANLNETQKQYLQPHFDACEQQAEHVKDYSQDRLMYQLSKISHNKSLRQKYQTMMFNHSPLSEAEANEMRQQISQLSGTELVIAIALYKSYFEHEVLPRVKAELQAHDKNMVLYVTSQAMALIACERGIDCSATSPMMYSRCMKYEDVCGLDYKTYMNTYFTPGIRNEIQITRQLLKNIFEFS